MVRVRPERIIVPWFDFSVHTVHVVRENTERGGSLHDVTVPSQPQDTVVVLLETPPLCKDYIMVQEVT